MSTENLNELRSKVMATIEGEGMVTMDAIWAGLLALIYIGDSIRAAADRYAGSAKLAYREEPPEGAPF